MSLPWVVRLAARLAPPHAREAFVGDLMEVAGSDTDPQARLRREARGSLPAALSWRIGWEVHVNGIRWLCALVILVLGVGQAWDSGVFGSTAAVQVIALAAVALLAATPVALRSSGPRLVAVAIGGLLTVVARVVAPAPLPELTLVMLPALFASVALAVRERRLAGPEGPKAA